MKVLLYGVAWLVLIALFPIVVVALLVIWADGKWIQPWLWKYL